MTALGNILHLSLTTITPHKRDFSALNHAIHALFSKSPSSHIESFTSFNPLCSIAFMHSDFIWLNSFHHYDDLLFPFSFSEFATATLLHPFDCNLLIIPLRINLHCLLSLVSESSLPLNTTSTVSLFIHVPHNSFSGFYSFILCSCTFTYLPLHWKYIYKLLYGFRAWTWTAPSLAVFAFTLKTKRIGSAGVKYFIATFAGILRCYSATATVKSLRWDGEEGARQREAERNSERVICRHMSQEFQRIQYVFPSDFAEMSGRRKLQHRGRPALK